MKYYSEITKKMYPTSEECLKAEDAFIKEQEAALEAEKAKTAELTNRKKEIEKARAKYVEARNQYLDLVEKFSKDYGFSVSYKRDKDTDSTHSILNFFNLL
jgi:hypothetical protein